MVVIFVFLQFILGVNEVLYIGFRFKVYVVIEVFFFLYSVILKGVLNVVILENVIWSSIKEFFFR